MEQIIHLPSPTDLSGFYLVYFGSTLLENPKTYGISHLLEHLITHRLDDLEKYFIRDGIDTNAYTSNTEIVVHFTGLWEKLSQYQDTILLKFASGFGIDENTFDNEKKIVIQEYKDAFVLNNYAHWYNLDRKLFHKYGALGELHALENITLDDCLQYYNANLYAPNRVILVSNTAPEIKQIKTSEIPAQMYENTKFYNDNNFIYEGFEKPNTSVSITYTSDVITDDFPTVSFICNMLGYGLVSPLYAELREKYGLVYGVYSYLDRKSWTSGVVYISTTTDKTNLTKCMDIMDDILRNPNTYLTLEQFEFIKSMYPVEFKKADINRYLAINEQLYPKTWSIKQNYDEITFDKVLEVYNKYFLNWYRSSDRQEFENLEG